MNVASKNCISNILTARNYVQDGLIGLWDGIENAGWGKHDPNATVWIDLVVNDPVKSFHLFDASWNGDSLQCHPNGMEGATESAAKFFDGRYYNNMTNVKTNVKTWEVCFKKESVASRCQVIDLNTSTRCCILSDNTIKLGNNVVPDNLITSGLSTSGFSTTVSGMRRHEPTNKADSIDAAFRDGEELSLPKSSSYYGQFRSHIAARDSYYGTGNLFVGKIYSIRVYNRDLSDWEIAANYAVDKARFNLP